MTGLKYAADKKAENLYLVQDSIKGLADYVEGNHLILELLVLRRWMITHYNTPSTNLRLIGILKQQQVVLSPVNEAFLKSKGDDFGSVTPSSILSNGPYLFKSFTSKSFN